MKKKMLMMLLAATLMTTTVMQTEMKAYALTQAEMIAMIKEMGGAGSSSDMVGGQAIPNPGYEFGSNYDSYVEAKKQERINVVIQRAAERGITVQQYLDQTGQSHAAKYFDSATLGAPAPSTTPQPQTPEKPKEEHKHSYSQSVTKEPTCTEEGETTFTCECGKSYTESIDVTGHKYLNKETIEPTCTETGVNVYTCECGDTYEEEIPVVDHEKGAMETTREATCTEAGERTTYCKYCGEALGTEAVEPYGHTEGELTTEKEPTMLEKGLRTIRCTDCNEILHSEEIPVEMAGWYLIGGAAVAALVIIVVITKNKKK